MENSNIIYVIQNGKEIVMDNKTFDKITKDQSSPDSYASKVFGTVQRDGLENEVIKRISGENDKFRWNNNLIKLLLEVRLEKEMQFNRPSCKKKKLWQSVANEINKITKLNVTSELCDIKYRNLLATYRTNKKKQKSSGESSITWEYFDTFDVVLGHKASSMPLSSNLGDSFTDTADDKVVNNDNVTEEETSNDSHETVQTSRCELKNTSQQKRKSETSLQTYLQQKLQIQEKREEEKKAHEENKLKFEKEKWEEKKILKEKEIKALLALAKALAESK